MIKQEFKTIARNKGLMLAMVAIILIPFVYSFCFLTSAWDPYGNTGKIPVAVVNLDQPATLSGKKIQAGADTVKQLRDDDQLEWHFVSAKQAAAGLKDNKYYTVVTIPEDFSKDAATVLDAQPKQMKLNYETNGSLNYVSEIISQVGTTKLNDQIKEKVTTAFVSELFSKIGTIGKGMKTAADGAKTLNKGVDQYTDGVTKVDAGLGQMQDKVPTLTDGVQQLDDGGHQLNNGLAQLQSKVPELSAGVSQLDDGVVRYTTGADQLTSGLSVLYGKSINDSDQDLVALATGIGSLNDKVPELSEGVGQLDGGATKLQAGVNALFNGVVKNPSGAETISSGVQKLNDGIKDLKYYTLTARNGNPNLPDGVALMTTKMNKLLNAVKQQNRLINSAFLPIDMGLDPSTFGVTAEQLGLPAGSKAYPLIHNEKAATAAKTTANTDLKALETAVAATTDPTQKQALQAALDKFKTSYAAEESANDAKYATVKGYLAFAKTSLNATGNDSEGDPVGLLKAVTLFETQLTNLNNELSHADISQHATYTDAVNQLSDGLALLNDKVNTIQQGVTEDTDPTTLGLVQGVTILKDGMNRLKVGTAKLNGNVPLLSSGVSRLYAGSKSIYNGTTDPTNKPQSQYTLTQALTALNQGGQQLAANSIALRAGSGQLHAAVPTLSNGVGQLYAGSGTLASGLDQLNDQVPTLADGVGQLKAGTTQLVANNPALNDGTKKLSDGLADGYQQVASTHLTKLTAKMFASPSQTVQKRYSTVQNYGAALAPYVLALALFIAIILFNFAYPMKREADDDRSLRQFVGGKVMIGAIVALAAGFVEATLILIVGLPVAHVGGFYAMTMLFALAAMALTQMLTLAFDRVGIFVALGLLTLSGSGGLFPAETISPLYEATQKFLPMTYAINGYRDAISGGIAGGTVATSVIVLLVITGVSLLFMVPAARTRAGWQADDHQVN